MTVQQAREMLRSAHKNLTDQNVEVYNNIITRIKKEILERLAIEIYVDDLPEAVSKKLKEDGYKVTSSSHRNETIYQISWEW